MHTHSSTKATLIYSFLLVLSFPIVHPSLAFPCLALPCFAVQPSRRPTKHMILCFIGRQILRTPALSGRGGVALCGSACFVFSPSSSSSIPSSWASRCKMRLHKGGVSISLFSWVFMWMRVCSLACLCVCLLYMYFSYCSSIILCHLPLFPWLLFLYTSRLWNFLSTDFLTCRLQGYSVHSHQYKSLPIV